MYQPFLNKIPRRRAILVCSVLALALLWLIARISVMVIEVGWAGRVRDRPISTREQSKGDIYRRNRCTTMVSDNRVTGHFLRSLNTTTARNDGENERGNPAVVDHNHLVLLTIIEGVRDMPALRNFVGSLHQFRDPVSNFVPRVIVYGFGLESRMRNEIALWSGVELVDANRVLLPAEAVQDSSIDNILQMSSFEPEQLYLFRLTLLDIVCRQFGLCLFLDVRQSFRSRISLTTVNKGLSEQGHILGCEDALPQTMAARSLFACDLLGFTFKSPAYEALVQTPLKWFRKNMCGYDWIRQKLDTFSMIGANVFPLAKLFETDSDAPVNQYYCFISFREDILYNFQFLSTRENTLPPVIDNKVRIGLGVPTSGINSQTVKDSSIVAAFLPSFFKSITEREWNKFEFVLYVAFDQGDPLWDDALHFATLNDHVKRMNFGIHTLVVKYVRMPPNNGWLTYIWNFLFALAIYDDCEYFYQLNDDLDFNNAGWASQLTDALNNMGGYGVAGPNDLSHNCDILTQSMVTRTHWEIFGWLYPPEIKDWFSDLWLTQVYGKNYTYCLQSVVIDNLRNKGERYQKCNTPLWTQSLQRGQEKIIAWRDEHETIV